MVGDSVLRSRSLQTSVPLSHNRDGGKIRPGGCHTTLQPSGMCSVRTGLPHYLAAIAGVCVCVRVCFVCFLTS